MAALASGVDLADHPVQASAIAPGSSALQGSCGEGAAIAPSTIPVPATASAAAADSNVISNAAAVPRCSTCQQCMRCLDSTGQCLDCQLHLSRPLNSQAAWQSPIARTGKGFRCVRAAQLLSPPVEWLLQLEVPWATTLVSCHRHEGQRAAGRSAHAPPTQRQFPAAAGCMSTQSSSGAGAVSALAGAAASAGFGAATNFSLKVVLSRLYIDTKKLNSSRITVTLYTYAVGGRRKVSGGRKPLCCWSTCCALLAGLHGGVAVIACTPEIVLHVWRVGVLLDGAHGSMQTSLWHGHKHGFCATILQVPLKQLTASAADSGFNVCNCFLDWNLRNLGQFPGYG